jgi:hypothetical protein
MSTNGEMRILVIKPEGKRSHATNRVGEGMTVKWILKSFLSCYTGFIWFRVGTTGGLL